MNYAGITIDFHDDRGATLRAKIPDARDLPDVIKTASLKPNNRLPNEAFALVAMDGGQVIRKLACHDAGTTAISVIYLMEHGDKLPQDAVKTAAWNLTARCHEFGLWPPPALTKLAQQVADHDKFLGKTGSVLKGAVDTTGRTPDPVIKTARPNREEDYAVVLGDRRLYPIDTYERVKVAERYWQLHQRLMEPGIRRQFAVKLAAKAQKLGYGLDRTIKEAGATTWANSGAIRAALEMRKLACQDRDAGKILDDLFEKRASMKPDLFAAVLERFDMTEGLSRQWGQEIPDPWSSTYGLRKTADELVWQDGPDRVTKGQLENLAQNHMDLINREFTEDLAEGLWKDPVGVFKSLPRPHKRILARMACDAGADGGSETDSEAPAPGQYKSASR